MKIILLKTTLLLGLLSFLTSYTHAVDLDDLSGAAGTLQKGTQVFQGGEAATAVVPGATAGTGLTSVLMQQLGVSQPQAEGGAGALFQLAKSRMSAGDFTALSDSVPEMPALLSAAPAPSPIGGGGMAATFLQLGLTPDMVQKFIPVVVQYVQGSGGSAVAGALQSALMGGM
ncbi:DUF2780 domain-containing protein [Nitrosomonas sp.]|uniref:DUF2780 domain-containing protein n=1 Tax=Nitrosomonas sp. TaxID=42353 RepID=UPI00260255C4|nr:DUF2780 domain-containing protein [Nitrosomonas sp.]MCW5598644.1 DUF2780 domain-containing protein [Nitrosomonas sp.]MCW5601595.1 DUF2780 domain-containing protein [Nitrosomonas sp.]